MKRSVGFLLAAFAITGCWPRGFVYIEPLDDSGFNPSDASDDGATTDAGPAGETRVDRIAMSHLHACARATVNGVTSVYCWGKLQHHAGGSETEETPAQRSPALATKLMDSASFAHIALGEGFGCFSKSATNSELYCWGDNSVGQLARSTFSTTSSPAGMRATENNTLELPEGGSFAVGQRHACALSANKRLWCWGDNTNGQRGTADTSTPTMPAMFATPNGDLLRVAAGARHTCVESNPTMVMTQDGFTAMARIFCMGDRTSGQTGFNTMLHPSGLAEATPLWVDTRDIEAQGYTVVSQLAAGANNSCVIMSKTDGASALYCWGDNTVQQIATPMPSSIPKPSLIPLPNDVYPRHVAIGNGHLCALTENVTEPTTRRVFCWGQNSRGQLARASTSTLSSASPLEVILPATPTAIAAGGNSTCAIADRRLYCWGDNLNGILGIGSEIDGASTPTEVTFR